MQTSDTASHHHPREGELGRLMIGLVAEKLGQDQANAWVNAILEPTRAGTPERRASDKANSQLVRNVLTVSGGAA